MTTAQDLREAIMEGAVQRVRPKMMTVAAIMGGLLPIMWTTGTGADVMKRIAAPAEELTELVIVMHCAFAPSNVSPRPGRTPARTFVVWFIILIFVLCKIR
jgi:hypothetical protein